METYVLINEKDFNKARVEIDKAVKTGRKAAVVARNEEFNRKIIEKTKVSVFIGLESEEFDSKKDKLKQRDSGFNHVLARLAHDNDVLIGINFSDFYRLKDKELTFYLGRMIQNIKLCNKHKVKIVFVNAVSLNKLDLMNFGLSLGMPTSMAKYAVENSINFC